MANNERENFSSTHIATMPDSDMPVFSFNNSKYTDKIMTESFNISGNKFSAFYDADHKLIFVLDETHTENTPNILLVIAEREGRKWDDILSNDYKMDLEDVRPKKDNKYQKLDINYTGLPVYGQLIADYKTGGAIDTALDNLNKFRITVGQELALARLNAAMREIEISTETIRKTEESLIKLHSHIKALKTKLRKIRSEVGKKPTKESAAKILKIQSQIDKANEKEKRAKARLRRAKKRQEDAKNDSIAARNTLKATNTVQDLINIEKSQEPQMADEPKPLFNKDPEIIDDKIAFQPIGFEMPSFNPTDFNVEQTNSENNTVAPEPTVIEEPVINNEPMVVKPVINTPEPEIIPATIPVNTPQQTIAVPQQQPAAKLPEPEQPVQPAVPPAEMERPASPITNPDVTVLQPPAGSKKPSPAYYIMLVILIGLCILTLSIYQSRMDKSATPNLAQPSAVSETVPTETQTAPAPQTNESAFIMPEPKPTPVVKPEPQPVPEPAPVIEPQPQPTPVIEPMPEPVAIPEPVAEPEPMPEPVATPEPVQQPEPVMAEPQPEPQVITVPDEKPTITLPLKPEYPVHGPSNYNEENNTVSSQLCTSGKAPDENGCCSGESFRWVESMNGYACCAVADGECYPPLK